MKNKKKNRIMLLLILLLAISIGYAALSTTLKIIGTTNISKNTWSVYWDGVSVTTGSKGDTEPTIGQDSTDEANTKVTWGVVFDYPGEFYEFTVDAVNAGTIDAMITKIESKVNGGDISTLPPYIKYSVTYADGMELANYHLLKKADTSTTPSTLTREKYKIRVEYDRDAASQTTLDGISNDGDVYNFTFGVTYSQANDSAIDIEEPDDFQTDQWGTIARALKNDPDAYPLGSSRNITLDLNGNGTVDNNEIFTLRLANSTTPAECSTAGFSQTACGIVIEFANPIVNRRMNEYIGIDPPRGSGNIGGWELSEMRGYLKDTIYPLLPSELKSIIKDTYVVSSHGGRDSANFITTDKLYLLSYQEIYAANNSSESAYQLNRQLDYYEDLGVTTSNTEPSLKYWHGTTNSKGCWTRSAWLNTDRDWFFTSGASCNWRSDNACGVAPAFRIN